MSDIMQFDEGGVEQTSLKTYTEKAYLDYSMYVILDRALPHVGDGLKPVQRRIIYAMSELGLKSTAKYKKSARTVGDVIGKFHPHGDGAAYEAMVLMAQSFSYRYPLVDGQGNWGSPDDPKSFAAMRYTESRLGKNAELLLSELGLGTAQWKPNFDGTMDEPVVLPARVPHVLLNGGMGIAVGMATNIPPHNLQEVTQASIYLLDNPKSTVAELMDIIQGPDYPTEAEIITAKDDILSAYETGRGSIKMRAVWEKDDGDIVITALPYQVSGSKILEQIAQQMQSKKLPMVSDLRDESDHENPTRLVIVPRSNRVDVQALMSHLCATTDLEKNYSVNLNIIGNDGKPAVKNIRKILKEWLAFRTNVVRKRLEYRLEKVMKRLHTLDGLLIAFLNIDEVIEIIRYEDKPKQELMKRFKLSDQQAESILDLKLRHLAKLEEEKIKAEQAELNEERSSLEKTLGSEARLKTLIKKELQQACDEFGDDRRSPLKQREEANAFSETDLLSSDPVTVVVSEKGWIRSAKGHDIDPVALNYKSGDSYQFSVRGKSNQPLLIMDTTGRAYAMAAHTLPSARSLGEPITGKVNAPSGAGFVGGMMGDEKQNYLISSDAGYGFVTNLKSITSKNRAGKAVLTVPKGGRVLSPVLIDDVNDAQVVAITNEGRMLVFPISELPVLTKGKGNKIISIPSSRIIDREEFIFSISVIDKEEHLVVYAGKRHLKLKFADLEHYMGERGRRGSKLPRGFQRVDKVEVLSKKVEKE